MERSGIIDIVTNVHTPEAIAAGQFGVDEFFMDKVRMPDSMRRGMPMEEYVEKMDRAGIERSLLIAVRAGDMRVEYSHAIPYEDVAALCEQFPGRFHGLAGIDPSRVMKGLREFEYAVTELGFVGAHLYPHWFEQSPDSAMYYPFYAKCCELDVPIMMQIGHCLDYQRDRVLPSVGRPITLDRVAIDFPDLKLIGIHLGWPWTEEMIAISFKHNNVYIAGDAYAPKHWPRELRSLRQHLGQAQGPVRDRLAGDRPRTRGRGGGGARPAAGVVAGDDARQRDEAVQARRRGHRLGRSPGHRSVMSSNSDELCERFGIEHPIFQAGMGFVSTALS